MFKFVIPGQPFGNQRVARNQSTGAIYLPKKSTNYQGLVAWNLRKALGRDYFKPTKKPIAITILSFYEIPKSWPKWKRNAALEGDIVPTSKPDVDNIEKAIFDALNNVAYCDDAQIVNVNGHVKRYSNEPRVEVSIEVLELLPATCTKAEWENHQSKQIDILV